MYIRFNIDNEVIMGAQYLRECESVAHAQYAKKKALNIRGTNIILSDIICDYDGRYGYIAILEKTVYTYCAQLENSI